MVDAALFRRHDPPFADIPDEDVAALFMSLDASIVSNRSPGKAILPIASRKAGDRAATRVSRLYSAKKGRRTGRAPRSLRPLFSVLRLVGGFTHDAVDCLRSKMINRRPAEN